MKTSFRSLLQILAFVGLTASAPAQWSSTTIPTSVYTGCITTDGHHVFVGTDSAVYVSTDGGFSWRRPANAGMSATQVVYALAVTDSFLFAATGDQGVLRSSDLGSSWTGVNNGLPTGQKLSLATNDSGIFVGTSSGVYYSPTNGSSWQARRAGMGTKGVRELVVDSAGGAATYAAASGGGGLFRSTDRGITWSSVSQGWSDSSVWALAAGVRPGIFAGTETGGIWYSANGVSDWSQRGLSNTSVQGIVVVPVGANDQNVLAGTFNDGVFCSSDDGLSWIPSGGGIPGVEVNAIAANATHAFVGLYRGGVWRASLGDIVVPVEMSGRHPESFSLSQNYPNPFNPTTTVEFDIPDPASIRLVVSDLLGRELLVVADNRRFDRGRHFLSIDASTLPTGVYLYTLEVRSQERTLSRHVKKMLLIR